MTENDRVSEQKSFRCRKILSHIANNNTDMTVSPIVCINLKKIGTLSILWVKVIFYCYLHLYLFDY